MHVIKYKAACLLLGLLSQGLLCTAAQADAGSDLAASKGCLACHQVDVKRVGPPYRSVAERYADQANAVDYLVNRVRRGSRGDWGAVPMPAQTQISDDEAKALVEWILSLAKP